MQCCLTDMGLTRHSQGGETNGTSCSAAKDRMREISVNEFFKHAQDKLTIHEHVAATYFHVVHPEALIGNTIEYMEDGGGGVRNTKGPMLIRMC